MLSMEKERGGPWAASADPLHVLLLRRYGVRIMTVLLLIAGFALSFVVMWPINTLTRGSLFTGVVVTGVLCGIILPYPVYQILHLIDTLERTRRELLRVSTTDALTGVYNRGYFMSRLHAACRSAEAQDVWLALVFFDIDDFKVINDTYGHDAGDVVLCAVAETCQAHTRGTDVFARYGGEEFVFLLWETTDDNAHRFAERIRQQIASCDVEYQGQVILCTASIGVSAHRGGMSPDTLLTRADRALYQAKNAGKNRVISTIKQAYSDTQV